MSAWTAVEIREEAIGRLRNLLIPEGNLYNRVLCGDFLPLDNQVADSLVKERMMWGGGRYNVCITNPPYSLAEEFVRRALAEAQWVVMLLRLNWLGSERRSDFLRSHPPDVYVLPNRPSFTGGGTDATEYAWFVWPPDRVLGRKTGVLKILNTTSRCFRSGGESALSV